MKNKIKKVIPNVTTLRCPRCQCNTQHAVLEGKVKTYRCLICKTVHA